MIRLPFGMNKSLHEIAAPRTPEQSLEGWRNIARTTLAARDGYGFHLDGAQEAMARAGYDIRSAGGSMSDAIDAAEAAYNRHFVYSTPHEHPCDEWKWRDVMQSAPRFDRVGGLPLAWWMARA
jgi:hypothetical protein